MDALVAQEATLSGESEAACVAAAKRTQDALTGLFSELGTVAGGLSDLLPLLKTLQTSLAGASEGLADFAASMPETRAELNGLIAELTVLSEKNAQGGEALAGVITDLVGGIEPLIIDLAQIVNLLAAAAPDLEETLGLLPQLISELAYGNIGAFVAGLDSLGDMGSDLSDGASAATAVNVAVDEMFQSGAGFPYGNAEGPTVSTAAVYKWELGGPASETASTGTRAAFAIVVLLLGAIGGTLLARRAG
jgi:ABC-type transporter Mla subunit MlaD